MKPHRTLALAAALAALPWAACNIPPRPAPAADGAEIYRSQWCADCHGESLEGTFKGPPLADLAPHWYTPENLAEYLADPERFVQGTPRVRWLRWRYDYDMPAYRELTRAERMTLARWLFTL
jgi:mono/diheme cytochrome c family protein